MKIFQTTSHFVFIVFACSLFLACSGGLVPDGTDDNPVLIDLRNRDTYPVERELSRENAGNLTLVITIESITIGFDYSINFNMAYTVVPNSLTADLYASIMITYGSPLRLRLKDAKGVLHDSIARTGRLNQTAFTVDPTTPLHESITFSPVPLPCTGITYQDDYSGESMTFTVKEGALPRIARPSLSPESGDLLATTLVTMSPSLAGASIAYTKDGSDPEAKDGIILHGSLYSAGFFLPKGVTEIRAISFMTPRPTSAVRAANFIVSSPVIKVAGGTAAGSGTGDGQPANTVLSDPRGLSLDPAGNLCFADRMRNTIRKIDKTTGLIWTIAGKENVAATLPHFSGDGGPADEAYIILPEEIVFNSAGDLFIADSGNERIRMVDHATGIISTWAGGGVSASDGVSALDADIGNVFDMVFDPAGDLYFVSSWDHRVRKISHDDARLVTTVAGSGVQGFSGDGGSATLARFNNPEGLALDAAGNLFISDSANNRIRKLSISDGKVTTIAGTGFGRYWGDGASALSADLNTPLGLAFDSGGSLYIADTGNSRVRKIEMSTRIITTVAGNVDPTRPATGRPVANSPTGYPVDIAFGSSGAMYMSLNMEVASVE